MFAYTLHLNSTTQTTYTTRNTTELLTLLTIQDSFFTLHTVKNRFK